MDLNDIKLRLERIYTALKGRIDINIQKYIKTIKVDGGYDVTFTGDIDDPETTNIVFVIIEHIAKLKDHLKNKMGEQKKLVEEKVNECLELQLIMDLSNAEKHGYPLKKTEKSNRSPRIQNIVMALNLPAGASVFISEPVPINENEYIKSKITEKGGCYMEVYAEIVDGSGAFICKWPEMIDKALGDWENFIQEHRLG